MTSNNNSNNDSVKFRVTLSIAATFILITALMLSWFYRPYVQSNNIHDFHFADNIMNLFFIPMITLFYRAFSSKYSYNKMLILMAFGFILVRFLFDWLWGVFPDIYEIAAIVLSVLFTFGIGKLFKIK